MNEPIRAALERLVFDIDCLADSSSGVAGLHQNGDIASWAELMESGRFSSWVGDAIAAARAALDAAPVVKESLTAAPPAEGAAAAADHVPGARKMVGAVPAAEGEVAELAAEIRHFLAGYRQMRGLDPEHIYSIHRGDAMEAHITVSGLTRAADLLEQRQAAPVPVGIIPVEYFDIDSGARIVGEASEEGPGGCWVVLNSRHINPFTEFPTAEAAWSALQAARALPLPSGEVKA